MKIIDGDGHIWEDAAGISKFLPKLYTEQGPLSLDRLFPPIDHSHFHVGKAPACSFSKVGPEGWLEFIDEAGIDTAVLYPSWALAYGRIPYPDWAIAVCRAYNDWLAEAYLIRGKRLRGMALLPLQDPEAACSELRRAVRELGMCGAVLPATGLKNHLGAKDYWSVYAEADRLGCCLAIHGGSHSGLGFDTMNVFASVHALGHPLALMINFSGITFNGVLDRFPHVRWGFLEGGVSWLLTPLERFDRSYQTQTPFNPRGELLQLNDGQSLADYIRTQIGEGRIFIGSEGSEPALPYLCSVLGRNPFLFSSDFPHEVSPAMCKKEIEELVGNPRIDDAAKAAILYQNAERFYGL